MGVRALLLAISVLVLIGCKSKKYISEQAVDRDSAMVVLHVRDSVCMRESLAIRGETIVYVRNIVKAINNHRDSVILHEVQETKNVVPKERTNYKLVVIIFASLFGFLYIVVGTCRWSNTCGTTVPQSICPYVPVRCKVSIHSSPQFCSYEYAE